MNITPTVKDVQRLKAINQETLANFYGWFIDDVQNQNNKGAPLCAAICDLLDKVEDLRGNPEFDVDQWDTKCEPNRPRITTVPDLYSDPMEAIKGGLGLTGIPNSWMVDTPHCWVVVSHLDGELLSDQRLDEWLAENGEPARPAE